MVKIWSWNLARKCLKLYISFLNHLKSFHLEANLVETYLRAADYFWMRIRFNKQTSLCWILTFANFNFLLWNTQVSQNITLYNFKISSDMGHKLLHSQFTEVNLCFLWNPPKLKRFYELLLVSLKTSNFRGISKIHCTCSLCVLFRPSLPTHL